MYCVRIVGPLCIMCICHIPSLPTLFFCIFLPLFSLLSFPPPFPLPFSEFPLLGICKDLPHLKIPRGQTHEQRQNPSFSRWRVLWERTLQKSVGRGIQPSFYPNFFRDLEQTARCLSRLRVNLLSILRVAGVFSAINIKEELLMPLFMKAPIRHKTTAKAFHMSHCASLHGDD